MPIKVASLGSDETRIDHPTFQDVHGIVYALGEIIDMEVGEDNKLTDVCNVSVDGREVDIPIFYHCKKHCYDEEVRQLKGSDALTGAARAFMVGDEVKVVMEEGRAKYVIGHKEQNDPPRMCLDLFRMDIEGWFTGSHDVHYTGSQEEEFCDMDAAPTDYYGEIPLVEKEGITLFGKREFQTGTILQFWGDFYVQVGPLFYIIRLTSIGMPLPYTGQLLTYNGVWSEERETELIDIGAAAEDTIPTGAFGALPVFPLYPSYVKELAQLREVLWSRWGGYTNPCPRWVYTKLWGQSHEE